MVPTKAGAHTKLISFLGQLAQRPAGFLAPRRASPERWHPKRVLGRRNPTEHAPGRASGAREAERPKSGKFAAGSESQAATRSHLGAARRRPPFARPDGFRAAAAREFELESERTSPKVERQGDRTWKERTFSPANSCARYHR